MKDDRKVKTTYIEKYIAANLKVHYELTKEYEEDPNSWAYRNLGFRSSDTISEKEAEKMIADKHLELKSLTIFNQKSKSPSKKPNKP